MFIWNFYFLGLQTLAGSLNYMECFCFSSVASILLEQGYFVFYMPLSQVLQYFYDD